MAAFHAIGQVLGATVEGRFGASGAVCAAKAECRLWVQKGDDRRTPPQQARGAGSRHLPGDNCKQSALQRGRGPESLPSIWRG
jgi:hypothetical protein